MAEGDAGLGGTAGSSDGSSACEPLCALTSILCTSAKDLVEGTFDESKKSYDLDDKQDSHEGLLCAICLCPVSAQIIPKGGI